MTINKKGDGRRVVVGLSGGVDSAVTAASMLAQGYDVHGVTLKLWKAQPAETDNIEAAQAVADHLGIPLTARDLENTFYNRVVEPFLDAYAHGETPNPCVFCNPTLKFEALLAQAGELGARWIATGHYARVLHSEGGPAKLLRGRAAKKEQSYALYRLTQRHLQRLLLPLGEFESKAEVRAMARRLNLPSADVADSQDLCFMAGSDYRELVSELRPAASEPGPIYNSDGDLLGEHTGLSAYTVGQRSGLSIVSSERLYVLQLDAARNALTVGPRSELARDQCRLGYLTFIEEEPPAQRFQAEGRIRYRAPLTPITVRIQDSESATVDFKTPQYGVAPGQSLVIYDGEYALGGGVIVGDRT
jgi:tRNA-specific 2-thiouridylase